MIYNELILMAENAKKAIVSIASESLRREILNEISSNLILCANDVLSANLIDVENAKNSNISNAMLDRLTLNLDRIKNIANSIIDVAKLPSPIKLEQTFTHQNGMVIQKMRVPMGVIAMIFEARPNVTVDASVLSIMSGNAVILRGGKEAINTNLALTKIIRQSLKNLNADENAVNLITDTSHESAEVLMTLKGYIDLLIPRGSKRLIDTVTQKSKVPVIETGAGNCHVYVEKSAKLDIATNVVVNGKTSRPSVCNATEKLLIDEEIAPSFLPTIANALKKFNVEIRGCEKTKAILGDALLATDEDWAVEYNDYVISIKVVKNYVEAIEHINRYGTKHSEAIITENEEIGGYFTQNIDASSVYINASTRFTDGGEFGLGAEIGISTQKLHVRGPFALDALTTTKYVIRGNGQTR